MANFDVVFAYDKRFEDWLRDRGYPSPKSSPKNRLPTSGDIKATIRSYGGLKCDDTSSDITIYQETNDRYISKYIRLNNWEDWDDDSYTPEEAFTVYADLDLEVRFIHKLSQLCGDLVIYPDSGGTSIIISHQMDVNLLLDTWSKAQWRKDDWEYLHSKLYGS